MSSNNEANGLSVQEAAVAFPSYTGSCWKAYGLCKDCTYHMHVSLHLPLKQLCHGWNVATLPTRSNVIQQMKVVESRETAWRNLSRLSPSLLQWELDQAPDENLCMTAGLTYIFPERQYLYKRKSSIGSHLEHWFILY